MKTFIGTKIVKARPITRGEYNAYRGWTPPQGEEQNVDGYLVEYTDGGTPNHPDHAGYVSWSPKEQFDRAYIEIPTAGRVLAPHQQRVVAEKAELDERLAKLDAFRTTPIFAGLDADERHRMIVQAEAMQVYSDVLGERIEAFE